MAARRLRVVAGPAAGTELRVAGEPLVLGRGDGDAGLLGDDPEMSRRHAQLSVGGEGALTIEDLGSTNGTFVNGRRVSGPTPLERGDAIWVGSTTVQVVEPEAEPEAPQRSRAHEIVEALDRRAPVPPGWVAAVLVAAVVVSEALNFGLRAFALNVLDVPSDVEFLEPPILALASAAPVVANCLGFFANFRRPRATSMARFLAPTAIACVVFTILTLSLAGSDADVPTLVVAFLVPLVPVLVAVPALLSLPERARRLPPPVARG